MIQVLGLLLCWFATPALQLPYPGQVVEATLPVPIVHKADLGPSFSTLHPGERYRIAEMRHGQKSDWLRLDIPNYSSCWVDAASVKALTSYEPGVTLSADMLLSFVGDKGQHIVVYARPSAPPEAFPLEVFVVFGQSDQKSSQPVEVLPGKRQVLPLPPAGGGSDEWTLVLKPEIGLSLRLLVDKAPSARKLPPDSLRASIKGCDLCRFEPHLPPDMSGGSLDFFGPASILPSLTNLTEAPYLSVDVRKWRESGSPHAMDGTIVSRTLTGAYLELPLAISVDEVPAESSRASWRFGPLALVLVAVVVVVAAVLAFLVFQRQNGEIETSYAEPPKKVLRRRGPVDFSNALLQRLDRIAGEVSNLSQSVDRLSSRDQNTITELRGNARELSRENAELEKTSKSLSEQIQLLRAEAHTRDAESTSRLAALRKEAEYDRSKLGDLQQENQRLRSAMVLLDENGSQAVQRLIEAFETVESASKGIQDTINSFLGQDTTNYSAGRDASSFSNALGFLVSSVDAEFLAWVHDRRLELQFLCDNQFSPAPEIMEQRSGQTVSAEDLFHDVRERFFHRAVAGKWDKTLRLLQQFYHLPERGELPAQQSEQHVAAVRILQDYEEQARQAMCAVGVESLQIAFLSPVPAHVKLFVEFVRREAAIALYPRLRGAAQGAPELVLDVLSWGYLNEKDELWRGQKAKLVVSS
jgi:hypothetical protein